MEHGDLGDLLRRARAADPAALSTLVAEYGPRVLGLLQRMTGNRDAAEDLTQETFLRLVSRLDEYEDRRRFEAWLMRIAANLARDYLRRRGRRGTVSSLDGDSEEAVTRGHGSELDPGDALDLRDQAERLSAALARLAPAEREVVLLRHYGDWSFKEISEFLGVPLGTALARGHRALAKLRMWLEGEAGVSAGERHDNE